jgi:SAM-dependent methyltransferase
VSESEQGLGRDIELYQCPGCGGGLNQAGDALICGTCEHRFEIDDGIPLLYWPNEWEGDRRDVTGEVKAFYEETPFPNYDDFDSLDSLARKARQGIFARLLDEQIPPGARIIECGSGTSQLSNFLSLHGRDVFASDLCLNSLRLGQRFAKEHDLHRVRFTNINLFRPPFKPGSFDLVISNGVLHHTSDPFLAFQSIAKLVRPGGYILVGLYHQYGRLITDTRRLLFHLSGDRFKWLDPNLRSEDRSTAKKQAWFADQYKHPHESKHTIGETLGWLEKTGLSFVKSIPRSKPLQPVTDSERLFVPEKPGSALERFVVEMGMIAKGSQEGGFFIVIARKPAEA